LASGTERTCPDCGAICEGFHNCSKGGHHEPVHGLAGFLSQNPNLEAIKSFIEWAEEKGLDVESLTCGDVTVSLREQAFRPVVVKGEDLPDLDEDDDEFEEDGRPEKLPPPRDYASAMARQLGVRR
jgi:hypothetical protein